MLKISSESASHYVSTPADEVLSTLISEFPDHLLASSAIEPMVADAGPGLTLVTKLNVDGPSDPRYQKALWEAQVLQGDLAETLATSTDLNLANVVSGTWITTNASDQPQFSGSGDCASQQLFSHDSDDRVSSVVDQVVASSGLRASEEDVYRVLDDSLSVVIDLHDVDAASKLAGPLAARLLSLSIVLPEATYLQFNIGPSPVAVISRVPRVGATNIWVREDLRNKIGITPLSRTH